VRVCVCGVCVWCVCAGVLSNPSSVGLTLSDEQVA
jgi:Tfp pilus assembly protein PilZ